MPYYTHILFDLDGTLDDPYSGITRSAQYALKRFGIHAEQAELARFIGPPLYESFMRFYGLSRADAELAVKYYRELYNEGGAIFDVRIYDGIPELLTRLRDSGRELILATSKPIVFADRILERFDLARHFDFTFGCELDGTRVRKDEVIAYALEQCQLRKHLIDPTHAVMVGDRMHDIEGAHANSLPAIGVLWGYGSRDELTAAGADYLAADLAELETILCE